MGLYIFIGGWCVCVCGVCRFITRPDVKDEKMTEFIDWALTVMSKANTLVLLILV